MRISRSWNSLRFRSITAEHTPQTVSHNCFTTPEPGFKYHCRRSVHKTTHTNTLCTHNEGFRTHHFPSQQVPKPSKPAPTPPSAAQPPAHTTVPSSAPALPAAPSLPPTSPTPPATPPALPTERGASREMKESDLHLGSHAPHLLRDSTAHGFKGMFMSY